MAILLFSLTSFAETVVEKVRIGQHGSMTRVVLESTKLVKPKMFTLPGPRHRVVLDFPAVKFKQSLSSVNKPPKSLVTKLRQGLFKPGTVRMVLDVEKTVAVTMFTIPARGKYKHRLVLDLRPAKPGEVKHQLPQIKNPTVRAPIPKKISTRKKKAGDPIVVVIDPGHGGVDPGAVTRSRTYEKNIVLAVSKKIRDELKKQPNVKVYMTRDTDIFVKLHDRVRFAQRKQADVFLSIHADAHNNRRIRGGSVYALSEKSSDKEAARLARIANEGDLVAGIDLTHESKDVQNILIDLAQRETMNKSASLAASVLKRLEPAVHLRKKKALFAGFRVLKAPEIPSVLVELAYLSNAEEERLLKNGSHQNKLAKAVSKGAMDFIRNNIYRYQQ